MTQLTPHFSLAEMTVSETAARKGLNNTPAQPELQNLVRLCRVLEKVRTILDEKPILISSGYRSPAVNAAVGGSKTSAHMSGLAADFIVPGFGGPLVVCRTLQKHIQELGIDQLIWEFDTWIHLGLRDPPRHQALTIDAKGTRTGFR